MSCTDNKDFIPNTCLNITALDLPPPPDSWKHEIYASIAAEEEREFLNRKRKLPLLDEDLSEHLAEVKRSDFDYLPDRDSDETEDEDSDSSDEDGAQEADDIAKYLGPNENGSGNLSDLNSLYGDVSYDQTSELHSTVDLGDFDDRSNPTDLLYDGLSGHDQQPDWRSTSYNELGLDNRRELSWPSSRLPETEAASAVESILTSDDEDDNQLSAEFAAINALNHNHSLENDDEDEDDDDDEDDEEEEDGEEDDDMNDSQSYLPDSSSDVQLPTPNPCDASLQCAIDSITLDSMPVHPNNNPTPPFYGNHAGYGGHYDPMSGGLSHHRSQQMISSYHHSTQMSDPVLDEAVNSIL